MVHEPFEDFFRLVYPCYLEALCSDGYYLSDLELLLLCACAHVNAVIVRRQREEQGFRRTVFQLHKYIMAGEDSTNVIIIGINADLGRSYVRGHYERLECVSRVVSPSPDSQNTGRGGMAKRARVENDRAPTAERSIAVNSENGPGSGSIAESVGAEEMGRARAIPNADSSATKATAGAHGGVPSDHDRPGAGRMPPDPPRPDFGEVAVRRRQKSSGSGVGSGSGTKKKALVAAWSEKGCSGGEECADGCGSAGASAAADAEKDRETRTDAETRKGRQDERLASGIVGEANDDVPVADDMQKAFYQVRVDPASKDPRRVRELLVAKAAAQIRRHPTVPADPAGPERPWGVALA